MIATLPQPIPREQRGRFSFIPWPAYVAFCDALGERYIRVTYDRGEMEVMTVLHEHEKQKKLLGRLLEALTEELDIDIAHGGSMTCRNEEMSRALEPDECYWIENESVVRGRNVDLDNDPPPDLAIEVEISRSTLDRMSIYATFKVPEVWRWDGETLSVNVLSTRGIYRTTKRSKAFPFLPLDEFIAFVRRTDLTDTKLVRAFRAWVSENQDAWKR